MNRKGDSHTRKMPLLSHWSLSHFLTLDYCAPLRYPNNNGRSSPYIVLPSLTLPLSSRAIAHLDKEVLKLVQKA